MIEAEGLEGWLQDQSNAVGGRFWILADGRTFDRTCIEWEEVPRKNEPRPPWEEDATRRSRAWTCKRWGWHLIPAGELEQHVPLWTIWKSRESSGGWEDGAVLSSMERKLLGRAAGEHAIRELERSPPQCTIWDRWVDFS